MSKESNLTDFLTDVADAIREKKGTTAKINPQDFSSEIASIETGGGDTPSTDIPVIGDGKTYLYIKIAEKGKMTIPLYFSQTVSNGVIIDWGDGSATQTLSNTGTLNTTHTYSDTGEYVISLNPTSGCTLGLGRNRDSYCVLGSTGNNGRVYCNMLKAVEIGSGIKKIDNYAFSFCISLSSVVISEGVTGIGSQAFYYCYSLSNVVIPNSITSIGSYAFYYCYSLSSVVLPSNVSTDDYAFGNCVTLSSVVIPEGVIKFGGSMFYYCYSLSSIVFPSDIKSMSTQMFYNCYGMAYYDFRAVKKVPTMAYTNVFYNIPSDCKMIIPDELYDTWTTATNWASHASKMVKASEFNG